MKAKQAVAAGGFALAMAWGGGAAAQEPAAFYKGNTVTMIIGASPGGGYDTYARLVARHIGRHIPGSPTVNVQTMPGAGGIRAANFLAQQAPKDGTAITTFAGGPILEPLIGGRKYDYDSSKFTWIGAASKDTGLCVAWGQSPFKTIQDAQ